MTKHLLSLLIGLCFVFVLLTSSFFFKFNNWYVDCFKKQKIRVFVPLLFVYRICICIILCLFILKEESLQQKLLIWKDRFMNTVQLNSNPGFSTAHSNHLPALRSSSIGFQYLAVWRKELKVEGTRKASFQTLWVGVYNGAWVVGRYRTTFKGNAEKQRKAFILVL